MFGFLQDFVFVDCTVFRNITAPRHYPYRSSYLIYYLVSFHGSIRLFRNAIPKADFKYLSKSNAIHLSRNAQ